MPAVSKKQQKFFGIVRAIQKGEQAPTTPETAKAAADMKKGDVKKFASTKHKGLPEKKKIVEDKQVKKIIKQLRKSVKSHKKQADTLEKKVKTFKESNFSNITVGNKVGQTFQHVTGGTITLDGALGGKMMVPSQVTVELPFGEGEITVDGPTESEFGLAGFTKPLDFKIQKRISDQSVDQINDRLDASQKASGAETAKVSQIIDPLMFTSGYEHLSAAERKKHFDSIRAREAEAAQREAKRVANLVSNPLEFSNKIQAMDVDYAKRQAKIQSLRDKQDIVYNKYNPQLKAINDKIEKIASKYFNPDTWSTDDAINDDLEYKNLLKQAQKLSDAQKAENDPLQAEVNNLRSSSEFDYQVPGSKEYKDMQRVSFDEYYQKLHDLDYNKYLMGKPEERWKHMNYWAAQNKRAMNLSRIVGLKDALDPATGKPYDFFNPTGTKAGYYADVTPDTQLGIFVQEKLKNIGQIHSDHNELGSSMGQADLERTVLTKGAPALEVYVQELSGFEKYMTEVNDLLEKDLKEYKKILRKEYKTSSEIKELTYKQAENLKYYQDKLNDIKDHKSRISGIIPDIRKAFEGNFEPTPTKSSASPVNYEAQKAAVDKAYEDVGKGDLKDYEKLPPGLLKAVVDGQAPDVESVLSPTQLTKLQRLPLEAKTFLKYLTNKLPPVLNNDYMGKDFVRHAFSVAGFVDDGTGVKVGDNIIGSGQQLTLNKKTNQVSLKFTYDFKKSADEYAEKRYQDMNKAALLATAYADALTGGEYGADARGLITSPLAAGWWIQISKAFGGGKSTPGEITISLDELDKINSTMANDVKLRYNLIGKKKNNQGTFDKDGNYRPPGFENAKTIDKIIPDLGSAGAVGGVDATAAATAAATTKKKKKKVNESKLSFELIQQFREGLNPNIFKKLKEQTTFPQMQERIRNAKEKRREQQKKSEKLYMDTKKKGVKFYDKKGTGRLKDGKKVYD